MSSPYAQNLSPSVPAGMRPQAPEMHPELHAAPLVILPEASCKYPVLAKLKEEVKAQLERNGDGKKKFLPANAVDTVVTEDAVLSAFREVGIREGAELNRLTKSVLEGRQRLFLVLVQISYTDIGREHEKLSSLRYEEWDEINDKSLPLLVFESGFSFGNTDGGNRQEFKPEGWADNDLELFSSLQWQVLAPVFGTKDKFVHELTDHILPYLKVSEGPKSSGFFGEVRQAEIHIAHIDARHIPKASVVRLSLLVLGRAFTKS